MKALPVLCLLVVCVFAQQPAQLLSFNAPLNDTLGGIGSTDQVSCHDSIKTFPLHQAHIYLFPHSKWKIDVPIDQETDQTKWISVTVYPLMGGAYTKGFIPTLAITASNISEIGHQNTSLLLATATSPYQSIIIPPYNATGESVYIYIFVEVLNSSASVDYLISASHVKGNFNNFF
jgi:hypothetical protein